MPEDKRISINERDKKSDAGKFRHRFLLTRL
jgi:hypothetical protein